MDPNNVVDYSSDLELKGLRGTPCDPEEAIPVVIYSERTRKMRDQRLKRINIIGRPCFYMGVDNRRHIGKIIAFDREKGTPVMYAKEDVQPAEKAGLVLIEAGQPVNKRKKRGKKNRKRD